MADGRSSRCSAEGRTFPPSADVHRRRPRRRPPTSTPRPTPTPRRSGPGRPASSSTGSSRGTPSSSGTCRSRSGSSAGKLNASYNCLDRHVEAGHGDQVAYHWEGEPGDTRTITYARAARRRRRSSPTRSKALGVREGRPGQHLPRAWCPSCRWRCSRARASAPRTRWCSAASRPTRCATASTTPRRKVLITGDGALAPRQHRAAQGDRRRRGRRVPVDREGARAAPHRARRRR